MTPEQKLKEIRELVEELSKKRSWGDVMEEGETYVDDLAGGNFDDAFSGGVSCGEIELARQVMDILDAE